MVQHFLLSRQAKTLSLAEVFRMTDAQAETTMMRIRWADTDGQPVCSHCGSFTCYLARRPSGAARRLLPEFDRIEIVDPHSVRFHNKKPDVTLEGRLTRNGPDVVSKKAFLAAADWKSFARAPVGTGPYKVKEFKPDTILVLAAHDAYWAGKPPAREIRFVVVPEIASRINGLVSGQYDFITDVPPDQIETVEASPKHEVVGGPVLNYRLVVFDKNHPQLQDARIRRAFTHAIDRKHIVDTLWSGRTTIPRGLQWEYYGPMFAKDWQVPEYNPDLSRKLLAAAGYKGEPIPFRVLNNYYTNQAPQRSDPARDVAGGRSQCRDRDEGELAADLRQDDAASRPRLVELRAIQRSRLLDGEPALPARPAAAGRRVVER
jgi:hypothetical protein